MSEKILEALTMQGYTYRPPKLEDAEIVAELFNFISVEITGKKSYQAGDIKRSWKAPKFEVEKSVRLIFNGAGMLVGYVEVGGHDGPRVQIGVGVEVHPDFRGEGLGTTLLAWGKARAIENLPFAPDGAQVVMTAACNEKDSYRAGLYQDEGMDLIRHFFRMVIEFDEPPEGSEVPESILIRPYDEDTEIEGFSQAYLDSFQDHFGFAGQSLEDNMTYVRHLIANDPFYDPELWFVAVDAEEMVGFSICSGKTSGDPLMGNINVLGVIRQWRGRGLGTALLRHSFVELHKSGCLRAGLIVDASSLTGATRLYEKAGMKVVERYDFYQEVLREGEILINQ